MGEKESGGLGDRQEEDQGRRLTGQVALVDMGHFISETSHLTGPQCLNEGLHPAVAPSKAVEEVQEGVLVPKALIGSPQSVLKDTAHHLLSQVALVPPHLEGTAAERLRAAI